GSETFLQEVALEAIVERVFEELDLDIGQLFLKELQATFDQGHFILDQALAFGRDPAELVGQPEGVQAADLAVVQELTDLSEVLIRVISESLLFLERR